MDKKYSHLASMTIRYYRSPREQLDRFWYDMKGGHYDDMDAVGSDGVGRKVNLLINAFYKERAQYSREHALKTGFDQILRFYNKFYMDGEEIRDPEAPVNLRILKALDNMFEQSMRDKSAFEKLTQLLDFYPSTDGHHRSLAAFLAVKEKALIGDIQNEWARRFENHGANAVIGQLLALAKQDAMARVYGRRADIRIPEDTPLKPVLEDTLIAAIGVIQKAAGIMAARRACHEIANDPDSVDYIVERAQAIKQSIFQDKLASVRRPQAA